MYKMLFAAVFVCSPVFAQTPQPQIKRATNPASRSAHNAIPDGAWTVVCAEIDGRKMEKTDNAKVTSSNNTFTFHHDGKECTMRLELMPHGRVHATEVSLGEVASPQVSQAQVGRVQVGQTQVQNKGSSKSGEKRISKAFTSRPTISLPFA